VEKNDSDSSKKSNPKNRRRKRIDDDDNDDDDGPSTSGVKKARKNNPKSIGVGFDEPVMSPPSIESSDNNEGIEEAKKRRPMINSRNIKKLKTSNDDLPDDVADSEIRKELLAAFSNSYEADNDTSDESDESEKDESDEEEDEDEEDEDEEEEDEEKEESSQPEEDDDVPNGRHIRDNPLFRPNESDEKLYRWVLEDRKINPNPPRREPDTSGAIDNGFNKGYEPKKVLGVTRYPDDTLWVLVAWKVNRNKPMPEPELIPSYLANEKCPQLMIEYYQKHLQWKSENKARRTKQVK